MELENVKAGNEELGEGGSNVAESGNAADTQKSFSQEDVNNIIKERLSRERSKMEKEFEEKEKVARMSTEEKYQHELSKKEQELLSKEKDITTRELKLQAYSILKEKNMPSELMELLNYSSMDDLKKSVDIAEIAFSAAIEKSVNNRLRGVTPVSGMNVKPSSDPFLEGLKRKY